MRIMGFPRLLLQEESEDHCLRDCPLVIDGQIFFYNTYEESRLPFVFGSEADKHSNYLIRTKLTRFNKANVKCHFVFKGGNKDMKTKMRSYKTSNFDIETNYCAVAPVFLREVCLQTLEEKHFNYTTSVTEIKDDVVTLAQRLRCPVLSYDLDYFFKKVPYVMSLKYNNPNNFIMCKKVTLENFLKKHSLTEKKIAIFAALSDTQLFPEQHFKELLQTWDVYHDDLYVQNKYLLKWLSENEEQETIDTVTKFLANETDNQIFLNQISNLMANMVKSSRSPSLVVDYLYNDCKLSVYREDALWFEKGVAEQHIAIPYINLYKHKCLQGSSAIETKTSTDSVMVSIDVIKYAYNLLTNFQTTDIKLYTDDVNYVEVSTQDMNVVKPNYHCKQSVFENGWKHLKDLKLFEHFLAENNLNLDVAQKYPSGSRLLLLALTYFARKKLAESINVTKEISCFIICNLMLSQLKKKPLRIRTYDEYDPNKNYGISSDELNAVIQLTEKYFSCTEQETKDIFDGQKLKVIVELQYCILHMNYLNRLCGSPFAPIIYHNTINATFIYKLLHEMADCNVDKFIENLFNTTPCVLERIKTLLDAYKELLQCLL